MRPLLLVLALLSTTLAAAERKPAEAAADPFKETRLKLMREKLLDHFCVGVDAPSEWMSETRKANGCNWDFKVAYVSGGVGRGEIKWQKYVNFPEWYIKECQKVGCSAWFTWYMLSQSLPADYKPGPAKAAPANAKVAATMKDYFSQYKLFVTECGKLKQTAVVMQFEPDEWCHLLLSTPDFDPKQVDIKVGSCGLDELKDLPDDLYGYAAALKRYRDLYAPENVLLCCNPSAWRWQNQMSGQAMGEIMKKLCPDWELAVIETGDRDKGLAGKAPPYGTDIAITGNLENHLKWIEEFHKTSGMWVVVWQAAMGNTYFATCNDTPGHECDNLMQMLFEDYPKNPTISRYAQAGCCGWLFNPGQEGSTKPYDALKDGITNPPPIASNIGAKSEYPDDDGGYMRLRVGAYYKQPFAMPAKDDPEARKQTEQEAKKKEAEDKAKARTEAEAAAATKKADDQAAQEVLTLSDTTAFDLWEPKLKSMLKKALAAGRTPALPFGAERKDAKVTGLDDKENLALYVTGLGPIEVSWYKLEYIDYAAIATALAKTDDNTDCAVAAFYLLLSNQRVRAEPYIKLAGQYGDMVRNAFHLAAP